MSIFKAYDVRGIYGTELTEKNAYLIGYYLPKFLNLDKIKIAHDLRLSYDSLTKYLIKGLIDSNCQVIYLGESSTPNFYFSLFSGCSDGIVITASHNPKEYNGFKFMSKLNSFDSRNGLFDLEKLINKDEDSRKKEFRELKKDLDSISLNSFLENLNIKKESTLNDYISFLKTTFNKIISLEDLEYLKNIKFNIDFSSGVSSLAGNKFLNDFNLNLNLLNNIPDGNFKVHSPDPIKAKDFLISESEKNGKVDFSLAFDGDGDRIAIYDENSNLIFTDYLIAILIDYFSKDSKNFVCDLRISKSIKTLSEKENFNLNLIRVGRAFYKDFMDENDCILGAELSGHIFFKEFQNLDNPDIALIYILKIVALNLRKNSEFKISDLISKYKLYHKIEETNLQVEDANKVLEFLKDKFKDEIVMEIDGVSFDFKSYWFNVRKSNTEPIIRINFEGENEDDTILEFNKLISMIKSI